MLIVFIFILGAATAWDTTTHFVIAEIASRDLQVLSKLALKIKIRLPITKL